MQSYSTVPARNAATNASGKPGIDTKTNAAGGNSPKLPATPQRQGKVGAGVTCNVIPGKIKV